MCTEPVFDEVSLDGERYFIADGPRLLPQGAPTSPAITNLICRRLDRRLMGLSRTLGFVYSRYADDLTFSGSGEAVKKIGTLLKAVHSIVEAEGFKVHPDKTRVMRKSTRQDVTGLTVNEAVAVPRDLLRRYRAVLQQVERHGPAGKHFGPGKDVIRSQAAPTTGPATAARKKQPWYVTALVILLAVMLAFAIRPGGAVIAGAMLSFYFWRWWKR